MTKEQLRDEVETGLGLIAEGKRALVGGRACYDETDVVDAVRAAVSFFKIEGVDLGEDEDDKEDIPFFRATGSVTAQIDDQPGIVAALEARIADLEAKVGTPAAPGSGFPEGGLVKGPTFIGEGAPETLENRAKDPEAPTEEKPASKSRKKPEASAEETSEKKTTDPTQTDGGTSE